MGVQLGDCRGAGITPDRSKTFDAGARPGTTRRRRFTARFLPPVLGHLRGIVGPVWRSVVLWMLLALLTLANLIG